MKNNSKITNTLIFVLLLFTTIASKVQTGTELSQLGDFVADDNSNKCYLGSATFSSNLLNSVISGFQTEITKSGSEGVELISYVKSVSGLAYHRIKGDLTTTVASSIKSAVQTYVAKHLAELKDITDEIPLVVSYNDIQFANFWKRFFQQVNIVAELIRSNENKPFYFTEDLLEASVYTAKSESFKGFANQDQCIPFNAIKNFDEIICDLNNETVAFEPTGTNVFGPSQEQLSKARYTISFLAKVSKKQVDSGIVSVFNLIKGSNLISLKLASNKSSVDFVLTVGSKSYTIGDLSPCNDLAHVILNIEKEENDYVLTLTVRSTIENSRKSVSIKLPPQFIEGSVFNFPTTSTVETSKIFYVHFIRPCTGLSAVELIQQELEVITQSTTEDVYAYQSSIKSECEVRPESCLYLDNKECLICKDGWFLLSGICYDKCPIGYYADQASGLCKPCHPKCASCISYEVGITPKTGFFLLDGQCIDSCPLSTWPVNQICQECTNDCLVCASETTCNVCKTGYLLNGKCVPACPVGYFTITGPKKCVPCGVHCVSCVDENHCLVCEDKFYLNNGKCVDVCPDATFPCEFNKKCTDCPQPCALCKDKQNCTLCKPGYNLLRGECLTNCPVGYVPKDGYCLPCELNCDICKAENTSVCTQCNNTKYLKFGKCVCDCGTGFYADSHRVCQECLPHCDVCSNSSTCDLCTYGYNLLGNNQCVETCPWGYVSLNRVCVKCEATSNCKTCESTDVSKCITCFSGWYLYNNKCVEKCPPKTFPSGTKCVDCLPECATCSNLSSCDTCPEGFYLKFGRCVSDCGDGYTVNGSICAPCKVQECQDCDTTQDTCDNCKSPKVLYGGICLDACPTGTFVLLGKCFPCFENCKSCLDGETCEECNSPFNLLADKSECVVKCPDRYVAINGKCVKCDNNNCLTCKTDKTTCITCPAELFFFEGNCIVSCPPGTVSQNTPFKQCVKCTPPCELCKDTPTFCTDCVDNYVLTPNHTCEDKCPDYYANVNQVCEPCTQKECVICKTCLKVCLRCEEGTFLFEGKCVVSCPDGYYGKDGECKKCGTHCLKCECDVKCQVCEAGFSLYNYVCVETCPIGYVSVSGISGSVCQKCDQYCIKCSASDTKVCYECEQGTFLLGNKCVTICPTGYFTNTIKKTCDPCTVTSCNVCSSNADICDQCKDTLVILDNTCIAKCPEGYRKNGYFCERCLVDHCQICDTNVKTCDKCLVTFFRLSDINCADSCPVSTYPIPSLQLCANCNERCYQCINSDVCVICKPGYFLNSDNTCVTDCGCGNVGNPETRKCEPCASNCSVCHPINHDICTKCKKGFFLYNSKCYEVCPSGYWANSATRTCDPCLSLCETCSNGTTCDTCKEGFALYNNLCVDKCPDHFVIINRKCVECETTLKCQKCNPNDLKECIKCYEPFYLFGKTCIDTCPDGYHNLPNFTCEKCIDRCKTCTNAATCNKCYEPFVLLHNLTCAEKCPSGQVAINFVCVDCRDQNCDVCTSDRECTQCLPGWLLKVDAGKITCVKDCGEGFYPQENKCVPCSDPNCIACSGPFKCTDCKGIFSVLNWSTCVETCPEGKVSVNGVCVDCEAGCKKCSSTDINQCLECKLPLILHKGDCVENCPERWVQLNSNPTVCTECGPHCLTCCRTDQNKCLVCENPFLIDTDKTCVVDCKDGYTPVSGKCAPCEVDNCKSCDSNIKTCEDCKAPFLLLADLLKCLTKCPEGYYAKNGKCVECNNCPTCLDESGKCTACYEGYFLTTFGTCKTNCVDGQVRVGDNCVNCLVDKCKHCDSPEVDNCIECFTPYHLFNNICYSVCPKGSYPEYSPLRVCKACKPHCVECTNGSDCTKCEVGWVLQGQVCQLSCNDGYAAVNGVCVPCGDINRCKKCSVLNLNECVYCKDGFFLLDGKCVDNCGDFYYTIYKTDKGDVCAPCEKNCIKCLNADICEVCTNGKVLYNNDCVCKCPAGWVNVSGVCKKCDSNLCEKCTTSLNVCLSCFEPYVLKENQCVVTCGLGWYLGDNRTCFPCNDVNCLQCSSADVCVDCKDKWYLYNNRCVEKCPDGWVANAFDVCEKCTYDNCKVCELANKDNCTVCLYGNLFNKRCVDVCPKGYYAKNKVCLPCSTKCIDCTDYNNCFDCEDPWVLIENKCQSECPEKFVDVNGTCLPCQDIGCLNCKNDQTTCIRCVTPLLLHNGDCVEKCPEGFYSTGSACLPCESHCQTCSSSTNCTKCFSGWFLYNSDCVNPCPSFTYEATDGTCKPCTDNEKCLECNPANSNVCIQCNAGILYLGACIDFCPDGTYYCDVKKTCLPCETNCILCTSSTICKKCDKGWLLFNEDCVVSCPLGYVQIDDKCVKCGDKCETCCPSNVDRCLTCVSPFILYEHKCIDACPVGTFKTVDSKGRVVCQKCSERCSACDSLEVCKDCIDPFVLYQGKCIDKCPDATIQINDICYDCTDKLNCKKCLTNLNTCIECRNGTYLLGGVCVSSCPAGYFADNLHFTCVKCNDTCKSCTNSSECTECIDGYYFIEGTFVCKACNSPLIIVGKECRTCKVDHCDSCVSNNDTICKSCSGTWVLIDGKCYEKCPAGFYKVGQTCFECGDFCESCINNTTCVVCDIFHYLYKGKCVETCPPKTGLNNKKECIDCTVSHCLTCSGNTPDICLDCEGAYILDNNRCIEECPQGHFRLPNDTCGTCSDFCLSCIDDKLCVICQDGYFLKDGKCVNSCGSGFYADVALKKCIPCSTEHCCKCSPADTCNTCKSGYVLYDNQCLLTCPSGYFASNGYCKACNPGCKTCSSNDDCTECFDKNQAIWDNKQCVPSCPEGWTKVGKYCVKCTNTDCMKCEIDYPDKCHQCRTGYLLGTNCVVDCPEGFYKDNILRVCQPCYERCKTCDKADVCITCKAGFVLLNGQCLNQCPVGFFQQGAQCVKCGLEFCDACYLQGDKTICTDCDSTHKLFNGICIAQCPDGYYADANDVCRKCSVGCLVCTSETKCTQCDHGYFYLEGTCIPVCPDGYYPDCKSLSCEKCDVSCKTCFGPESNSCYDCADGYHKRGLTCVKDEVSCQVGFYLDKSIKECKPCDVNPHCLECSCATVCAKCAPGYNIVEGKCSLIPDTIVSVSTKPVIQSPTSASYQVSSKEVSVTGIESKTALSIISFIESLGVLKNVSNPFPSVLEYVFDNNLRFRLYANFVTKTLNISFLTSTGTSVADVAGPAFSDDVAYEPKYLKIVLRKKDPTILIVEITLEKEVKSVEITLPIVSFITSTSKVTVLFDDQKSNGGILYTLNIANYIISSTTENNFLASRPVPNTTNSIIVLDSKIVYSSIKSYDLINNIGFSTNAFRSFGLNFGLYLSSKITSKTVIGKIFYQYNNPAGQGIQYVDALNIIVDNVSNESVNGGKITISSSLLKTQQWYFVEGRFFSDSTGVKYFIQIKDDKLNVVFEKTISVATEIGLLAKLFFEAKVSLGFDGAFIFDPILLINNAIYERQALPYPSNCIGLDSNMKCGVCIQYFQLNADKVCEDKTLDTAQVLYNFYDSYNNKDASIEIPASYKGNKFTIDAAIRKLTHSLVKSPSKFPLISIGGTVLLYAENKSGYKCELTSGSIVTSFNFFDVVYEIINILITVDSGKATIYINNGGVIYKNTVSITSDSPLLFFSKTDVEIAWETIDGRIFPLVLSDSNINTLLTFVRKDVDPLCKVGNYRNGACTQCVNSLVSGSTTKCQTNLYGLKFLQLYGNTDINSIVSSYGYINVATNSVNSRRYFLTTKFRLHKLQAVEDKSSGNYHIVSVKNAPHLSFEKVDPSRDLIKLSVEVVNGNAQFVIVVNTSVETLKFVVEGLKIDKGLWKFFFASLNVDTKTLRYVFKSSVDSIDKTVSLTSFPEKLQNVGVVSVFTGGEGENTGELVPRGETVFSYASGNPGADENAIISKLQSSSYPTPITGAIDNCFYVTRNNTDNKDQCVECNPGYFLAIDGTCQKLN